MDRSFSIAILVLPDLVFAPAVVLELGSVLAAAVREVVASAGRVGAAIDGLAVACAGSPGLGVGGNALAERCWLWAASGDGMAVAMVPTARAVMNALRANIRLFLCVEFAGRVPDIRLCLGNNDVPFGRIL